MSHRVLVPLAEGCEELEAVTVIDLLRRAGIEVIVASLGNREVRCSRGTVLLADTSLTTAVTEEFDMVVLPGGLPGADHLNADHRVHTLLQRMAANNQYTAAICAAPQVLADAGLLRAKKATCYPGVLAQAQYPDLHISDAAVVQDGKVITSRGPGTAIDFALTLIACLAGSEKREEVEKGLMRG